MELEIRILIIFIQMKAATVPLRVPCRDSELHIIRGKKIHAVKMEWLLMAVSWTRFSKRLQMNPIEAITMRTPIMPKFQYPSPTIVGDIPPFAWE